VIVVQTVKLPSLFYITKCQYILINLQGKSCYDIINISSKHTCILDKSFSLIKKFVLLVHICKQVFGNFSIQIVTKVMIQYIPKSGIAAREILGFNHLATALNHGHMELTLIHKVITVIF